MKRQARLLFVLVFPLLSPCVFAQSAPLGHAEILGRLAVGYEPSYVAHLVKARGVSFSMTADFLEDVEAAGGGGILIDRLSSAEPVSATTSSDDDDKPFDLLAKCAELIHTGDIDSAKQECRSAIDENPESPWPMLATAQLLQPDPNSPAAFAPDPEGQAELRDLLRKAIALGPNLAIAHEAYGSALASTLRSDTNPDPPEMSSEMSSEMQKASSLDPDQLEMSENAHMNPGPSLDTSGLSSAAAPNADDMGVTGGRAGFITDVIVGSRGDGAAQTNNAYAAAVQNFRHRMESEPDLASNHVNLANLYLMLRDFDHAQSELEEGIRLEPGNAETHLCLANLYFSRHDAENGLAELREAIRIVPFGDSQHMALATALDAMGRTPDAVTELKAIIAIHPTHVEPSNALIQLYLRTNDPKSAIAELRRSLKASSDSIADDAKFVDARFEDLRNLADLLHENHELDAAAEQYVFLLRFKGDDPGLHNDYGNVLSDQNHLDEAIGEYNDALHIDPQLPYAHHNIGLCLMRKKDVDGAINEFRETVDLEPDSPDDRIYLGSALGEKGDLNAALEQFQDAIDKNPKNADAHAGVAFAFYQLKNNASAIREFKTALELQPNSPGAENNLAWIYATTDDPKLRNPAEALALARRAVESSPQPNPAFLDTLAEALLLNGQPAKALATEMQAAKLDPENSELQSRLAHFREAAQLSASARR